MCVCVRVAGAWVQSSGVRFISSGSGESVYSLEYKVQTETDYYVYLNSLRADVIGVLAASCNEQKTAAV